MWWLAVNSDLRWPCGETSNGPRLVVTMSKRQCELRKACAVCEGVSRDKQAKKVASKFETTFERYLNPAISICTCLSAILLVASDSRLIWLDGSAHADSARLIVALSLGPSNCYLSGLFKPRTAIS